MNFQQNLTERVQKLHYDTFIYDYYPLALPLMLDEEMKEYMRESIAKGVDGNSIVYDFFGFYLRRLESGGETALTTRNQLEQAVRKAGVNCIALTLGTPSRSLENYDNILDSIAWWKQFINSFDILEECHSVEEIKNAYSNEQIAILFALQDGGCIHTDKKRINHLYNLGVRIIQLTYNRENTIGNGCAESPNKGLTAFGKEAIETMNDLGIIIDLSHCNYRTTLDAIEISQKPVAITHSSCKAVWSHERAKTDEELKALAEKGGFLGIYTVPAFLSDKPHPDFNIFLQHLDHAVKIMGVDKVGIGSDWGLWSPDVPVELTEAMIQAAYKMGFSKKMNLVAGTALKDMNDYTDWIKITEALVSAGYQEAEIIGFLGRNFLDFSKRVK